MNGKYDSMRCVDNKQELISNKSRGFIFLLFIRPTRDLTSFALFPVFYGTIFVKQVE